jgi:hypothetical protein
LRRGALRVLHTGAASDARGSDGCAALRIEGLLIHFFEKRASENSHSSKVFGSYALWAALQRAQHAAPLRDIATAKRLGEESGSKLPHSRETWRRLIWRSAVEKVKGAGLA